MKDVFETAIIHVIGGVNRIVFRLTGGRVVLYRFRGIPGLSLMVPGRQTADPFTSPIPYLLDGEDLIVLADNETESYPERAVDPFNAGLTGILTVEVCGQPFDVAVSKISEEHRVETLGRILAEASLAQRHEMRRRRRFPVARLAKIPS
ncbi:hypothetical protein [Streptosporangium sp. NPDC000509]|uniref:hypothetical protein n=1 Tax=Streptosporangium sp. NPDC000509 TaxID=3366186 RepID=UPI0036AE7A86